MQQAELIEKIGEMFGRLTSLAAWIGKIEEGLTNHEKECAVRHENEAAWRAKTDATLDTVVERLEHIEKGINGRVAPVNGNGNQKIGMMNAIGRFLNSQTGTVISTIVLVIILLHFREILGAFVELEPTININTE